MGARMTAGWTVSVQGRPSVIGPLLVVRIALPGWPGWQAEMAYHVGTGDGIETSRRTPLGAVALKVARARLDAARLALRVDQVEVES